MRFHGALAPPLHLTSTYAFPDAETGGGRFEGEAEGYIYNRLGSPTKDILEQRIANLEGAEACLVTASGMGAITSLLWTLLAHGDEILVDRTLYGCTFSYLHHGLAKYGVEVRHADLCVPENLVLRDNTKVVYFETPANPNMRVIDIEAIAAKLKGTDVALVVDGTYTTPYLQRPLEHGADYVLHSATKYLSGHGDLIAGAVSGSEEGIGKVRMEGLKDMTGAVLSGYDAHLLLRGIKTLALRMDRHCDNAERLAHRLSGHPKIAQLHFPGLPESQCKEVAARQMRRFGGMIAFEMGGGYEAGKRFLNRLQMVTRAVSLGDCETLAQHPASMTHSTYSKDELEVHGISEGLVRLSVGLEDYEDIERDVLQALN